MKVIELKKIKKNCFGYEDISRALGISPASAKVSASRYTKQGILLRMKKNMYVHKEAWDAAGREEKFLLANMGQVPSYISLMTALDYYEITTQMQRDFFESVAVKRSKEINIGGSVFRYVKLAKNLYNEFKKEKGFFIASPEKALLDAFYLMSYGRYRLDLSSLDAAKLDRREIERLGRKFPLKTKNMLKKYGYL
jgi:predicted transcriptional regulator of viral defense system